MEDMDRKKKQDEKAAPPAGPHATPELTDKGKTPGARTLPERGEESTPGTG